MFTTILWVFCNYKSQTLFSKKEMDNISVRASRNSLPSFFHFILSFSFPALSKMGTALHLGETKLQFSLSYFLTQKLTFCLINSLLDSKEDKYEKWG